MADPDPCQNKEITLDLGYYYDQQDLVVRLIRQGRQSAAIHMIERLKHGLPQIKSPTIATILPP